ncbi:MAG: phosphotransferase [Kofleriaceae bacterium]|nr:phosphotransferase [Kofleriaceae bacterium]
MIEARLRDYVERLYPGRRVVKVEPLAPDSGATAGGAEKAAGYGKPVRLVLEGARESERVELVWRVASANVFGHERRADRAANAIQAFDDFLRVPAHVEAVDLGIVRADGTLVSVRDVTEHFLVTTFAPGTMYIEDLRRIATTGRATDHDLERLDRLAGYLASLHVRLDDRVAYRRAIRDLVGSGEGIYGIVDGYPDAVPGASQARLCEIEERCATWRWRLRGRGDRLTRTHGDFHPFNIVFGSAGELALLDASRGACGDPADDLAALAINFVFLAIERRESWKQGLGVLWHQWWTRYLAYRDDPEVLEVVPPFLAWRALVVANPVFYPQLSERGRHALLQLAETVLEDDRLDPAVAEELFT